MRQDFLGIKKRVHPNLDKFSSDQTRTLRKEVKSLESLFSNYELQKIDPKERLPIFFSTIDLRPYAKELRNSSPRNANRHCRQGILRALLAAPLENIHTFTALHRVWTWTFASTINADFALIGRLPSIATLSLVDTTSELPMALSVTPAHVNDGDMAP